MESRVSPLLRPYLSLFIIIVNEHNMDRKSLSDMVREVNLNEVPIEDILSDSVYKYDRVKSEITQIC